MKGLQAEKAESFTMMSTDPGKEIIRDYIAPSLKEAGFKKRGATWNYRIDGVGHVVNLQSSRSGSGRVDLTLNLGVWVEDVWKICWAEDSPRFIREEDCFPRFRVGQVLEDFQERVHDKWWQLLKGESPVTVGEEVQSVLVEKCLPVLQGIQNKSDALAFASGKLAIRLPLEAIYFAILQFINGKSERARATLLDLSSDDHWGPRVQGVLDRLSKFHCATQDQS